MCYNSCQHFRFNPMTGMDKCVKPTFEPCQNEVPEYQTCCGDLVGDLEVVESMVLCPTCKEWCTPEEAE